MRKFADLSLGLAHHMPRYPSAYLPEVSVEAAATHEVEKRSAQIVRFGTHVCTHLDAPFHAIPGGKKIDEIELSVLMGPARLLDLSAEGFCRQKPLDLQTIESAGIGRGDGVERLLINTGWCEQTWGTGEYFTEGTYLTREASEYLAALPNLKLIGIDFPNVDSPEETQMGLAAPNHVILLGKEKLLLENLTNLSKLPSEFELIVGVPKLVGGDGCPCRAFAFWDAH